jgi:serine/threonine-protein kinase RsbW
VSGPVDGRITCRRLCADGQLGVAAWVLPGVAGHVAGVRRWAQAIAAAWGAAAADTGLVVSELVTNAIRHTRSGRPGGTIIVAVAGGRDGVTVHVHDQGTASGQMPRPRPARAPFGQPTEGGRGLPIVIAVSAQWGTLPAAWCDMVGPGDPAAETGGCCTWCRLPAQLRRHDGKDGENA